jgi:hypothetical protein
MVSEYSRLLYTCMYALRFLPPNMATLIDRACHRGSQQPTRRTRVHSPSSLGLTQTTKKLYSLNATNTTVLLLRWSPSRAHQSCVSNPAPMVGWLHRSPTKLPHKTKWGGYTALPPNSSQDAITPARDPPGPCMEEMNLATDDQNKSTSNTCGRASRS